MKSSRPDELSAEFYQTFKEELTPTVPKLFHKIGREGTMLNTFYKDCYYTHPKTRQGYIQKGELRVNLLNEH
jgi:hypothetical protein